MNIWKFKNVNSLFKLNVRNITSVTDLKYSGSIIDKRLSFLLHIQQKCFQIEKPTQNLYKFQMSLHISL